MSIRVDLLKSIIKDPKSADEIATETGYTKQQVKANMILSVKEGFAVRKGDDGSLIYSITQPGIDLLQGSTTPAGGGANNTGSEARQHLPKDASSVGASQNLYKPPTVKIDMQILMPDMPIQLKLLGIRKANLDDAIASGSDAYLIDVAMLDEVAINQFCVQWTAAFKSHVKSRQGIKS